LNKGKEKKPEKGIEQMNTVSKEMVNKIYNTPVFVLWEDWRVRIALKFLFLIGIGYLAAVGKRLHPSMGIPGSSALWWLTPMVFGKITVPQRGSGLLMGATVALTTIPIGLNHTAFYNFGLYGFTGLALDVFSSLPKMNIRNPFGAVFCGMTAHLVKFGFILIIAITGSVTKHFLIVGMLQSAGLHLAFGAAAGLVGWGVVKAVKKIHR
jgi:hypothetical protein